MSHSGDLPVLGDTSVVTACAAGASVAGFADRRRQPQHTTSCAILAYINRACRTSFSAFIAHNAMLINLHERHLPCLQLRVRSVQLRAADADCDGACAPEMQL